MLSSSLSWQLFMGCVSAAEGAVCILAVVLLGAYGVSLWHAGRAPRTLR